MATQKISLKPFPHQRFRVQLDGVDFIFDLNWNARDGSWRFDLRDSDADLIAGNVTLAAGIPLLAWLEDDRKWAGDLILIDNYENDFVCEKDPCLDDLGSRYSLLYIEE